MSKLDRFIKTKNGDKTEMVVTSLNIHKTHLDFLREYNLNLSAMVREYIQGLMNETKTRKIK